MSIIASSNLFAVGYATIYSMQQCAKSPYGMVRLSSVLILESTL